MDRSSFSRILSITVSKGIVRTVKYQIYAALGSNACFVAMLDHVSIDWPPWLQIRMIEGICATQQ